MTILPEPNKILGEPKNTKLPSPTQVLSEQTDNSSDLYNQALTAPDKMTKLNQIIDNIPELPGNSESKKKLYKDLLLKGITPQESKEALETLSGHHPHQEGGLKYYINEKGLPIPLKNNERPPRGFEVASIWGSKSDAEDDSPVTDLAKTVFNVLPSAAENVVDLGQTVVEGITNKPSEYLNSLKNAANYLKFEKDPDIQKSLLNTDGIDEFGDILDSKRWDFSPNTLWGTANSLLGSVGEMYVGGKGVGTALKTAGLGAKTSTAIATYIGSFMTNLGEARDAAEAAGLEGRDKALFSSLVTAPIAAIDAKFDLGGKILSNNLMKEEKNAFIKKMSLAVADRMADGELTGQALNDLAKATTIGYSQLAKKWSKETVSDILQQGGEEAAQSFMLNAGEQLWDKLTDEEKKKFGTNAFSPESFAKYLQEGVAGLIGGAPTAVGFNKIKEQARIEAQNNTAYGIATKGPEAVSAFKENVQNELSMGKLTPKQAADAIFQVDAYAQYNEELKQGGVNLNEDQKKQVFNLTFQKQNLMSQVPTEYEKDKLGAIQQSQIDAKKKMADLIQKDIDKIVFRETVLNDPNASPAAREEIHKEEERTADNGLKTPKGDINKDEYEYEEPEIFNTDKRSFEEFPTGEWNQPTQNFPLKLRRLGEWLLNQPKKETFGEIAKDNEFMRNKRLVDTFKVVLPNGKSVRFASSMKRKPTKDALGNYRGHFREEMLNDRDNVVGKKVALKAYKLKHSGRIVVSVYNPDNGKHLGFVKERYLGNSIFNTKDEKQLQEIQDTIQKGGDEAQGVTETPVEPKGPHAKYKLKVVLEQPTRENLRKNYIKSQIEKHQKEGSYHPDYDKIYNDIYGKKFDRLNPTLYAEETTTGQESNAGTTQVADQENTGIGKKKKVGKTRLQQKVKDPNRIKAMMLDVYSPKAIIMQHFIGGGKISKESIIDFYKGSTKEANLRSHMVALNSKYGDKYAPTIDKLAHDLWEENKDFTPFADVQDYKNELEEVIQEYTSVVQMAKDLISTYTLEEQVPNEEIISDMNIQAEKDGITEEVDAIQESLEKESDESVQKLADDQTAFNNWIEDNNPDISNYEGDIPFQKESSVKGNIDKVVETIKKAMPKMTVVYNPDLEVAGYVYEDKIFINPNYAGLDTPIHEAGHVLIDAIGYNSPIIQQGIEQLKDSSLWAETKDAYPELNEEMLGKEVLAEAIGREGAGIFENESKQNKFIQWLNYFFALVKQKLGLDKSIAKSLAKQIIGGIGTKDLVGTETVQQQKVKESKPNKYSEQVKDKSIDDLYKMSQELAKEPKKNKKLISAVQLELGYKLFNEQSNFLAKKNKNFVQQKAASKDIKPKDILMKGLDHMPDYVPEVQKLGGLFEEAEFNKSKEANSLKSEFTKLSKAVIKEKNKLLGISADLFSNNAKYFDFLENPKGIEEVDEDTGKVSYRPAYWTEAEGRAKGFSKAQMDMLSFMHDLVKKRNEQLEQMGKDENNEVIKVDKGVAEAFQTEGILSAMSALLGNGFNMRNVRIKVGDEFKDLESYKDGVAKFGDVEAKLIESGSKAGIIEKGKYLARLIKHHMAAKRQLKEGYNPDQTETENILQKLGTSDYQISPNGILENKFLKNRNKDRGYSKDYFKAGMDFIDAYAHTKHISPLLPYIDAIEAINQNGFATKHAKKENVVEWLKHWKDMHIYKAQKVGKLGPEVDTALRILRKVSSLATMAFNIPAAGWNLFTGVYNNIRKESIAFQLKGLKRLMGNKIYDPKSLEIIKRYGGVNSDFDSNPKLFAGKLFDYASMGLNRLAEFVIQGSAFMGQMTEQDLNSFELDKDGNLTVKAGVDEKALDKRLRGYATKVSDIQGKYAERDRRNYMLGEFGKAISQYKVWLPDAWRIRFGEEYIDREGNTHRGSWREFTGQALKDLRADIKEQGARKAIWNNKNAMSNLKGALTVGLLLSFKYQDDDDEKKRNASSYVDKALGNVLMIFDPRSLKFTLSNPLPSVSILNRYADALEHIIEIDNGVKFDFKKAGKDIGKTLPYNKVVSSAESAIDFINEE